VKTFSEVLYWIWCTRFFEMNI